MADYYPLLSHVIEALGDTSAEVRRRLYESARTGFVEQLRKREPPLTDSHINQQQIAMEEAIRRVEKEQMSRPRREEMPKTGIVNSRSEPPTNIESSSDKADLGEGRVVSGQLEVEVSVERTPAPAAAIQRH